MDQLPIIFFPGINGDARIFAEQLKAFPTLMVAQWLPPTRSESMAAYAKRMARAADPGGLCLIGGTSFGGIIALEAAHHLQAQACLLFASSRDAHGLPTSLRMARQLGKLISADTIWKWTMQWQDVSIASLPSARYKRQRLSPAQQHFRDWALSALLGWKPAPAACPVMQLHGSRDNVFAARRSKADSIIAGAGHVMTRTHSEEANQFIDGAIKTYVNT
ncbi:alpha/beta fold hydrolase [Undibacterium sp. TC9W]|uniref:alpha/beta fold hydrolase n=1 Tax=Undibacterium sp. TC9W TaxID=3413053 RepID=UPI003BF21E2E